MNPNKKPFALRTLLLGAILVATPLGVILAQTPDELVEQAREAAREDRNDEAAELFARAIDAEPGLRSDILREYADQLTFITQAAQAVPLFREVLAGNPSAEERRRAERGLALALLWSGQNEDAARAWQALLDSDPQDEDARGNLVQALTNEAREAAGADRNARAAQYFARAIAIVQGRPASLLVEYADQLTFSDRAAQAVPLYNEAIATGDLAPDALRSARRGRALAYLWSQAYQEAISAWEGFRALDPADEDARRNLTEAFIGAARMAAARDRNREAADLFARAIALSPERRNELALEYAAQLTFSDRAAQAVPLYREVLAGGSLAREQRREAMLGLALALSWSDQLPAALATYDEVIVEHPQDVDAWIGRGRILSWLDRNREALDSFERALTLAPGVAEAVRGAAQGETNLGYHRLAAGRLAPLIAAGDDAQALLIAARAAFWMGRPDRARILAEQTLALRPDDEGARAVLADIDRNMRPLTDIEGSVSTQNDGLVISGSRTRQSFSFNDGLTTLGFQHALTHLSPRSAPSILINGVGGFGRHRMNDAFEINGAFLVNKVTGGGRDRTEVTYDTWLTFWPNDFARFDASAGRAYFDDVRSISRNISIDTFGFSLDYRFDPDFRVAARSSYGFISDGNRRFFGQVEAERRLSAAPALHLGARYTHFNFSRPELDNGYFNPDWMHSAEATLRLQTTPAPGWTLSAAGSAGYEFQPGEQKPVWSASLGASYAPTERLSFRAEVRHQDSSSAGGRDGFRRTTFGGGLQVRW